jgi:hypothetical protein
MSVFSSASSCVVIHGIAMLLGLAAVRADCLAAPVPTTCINPNDRNSTALPGQAGYGVSGPVDKDTDRTEFETDMCLTFYFDVPTVTRPFGKSSGGRGGWGALVLDFSGPIDGGSFIFDPECPTTQQGIINPTDIKSGVDGTNLLTSTMLQIVPTDASTGKPIAYPLGQTGTDRFSSIPDDGNPFDKFPLYQQLVVTIMYDATDPDGNPLPAPTIVYGQSFWQSKAKVDASNPTPQFTFLPPGVGSDSKPLPNTDLLLVSEPSYQLLILLLSAVKFAAQRIRFPRECVVAIS